ncbi:hypothetical protein D3C81_1737630 [compost metagenome]
MVHLVLSDIGIDLPMVGVYQDTERLLAIEPLPGLPVRVQVQPSACERCLQVEPGDLAARGTGLFVLHHQALLGGGVLSQPSRVGEQA